MPKYKTKTHRQHIEHNRRKLKLEQYKDQLKTCNKNVTMSRKAYRKLYNRLKECYRTEDKHIRFQMKKCREKEMLNSNNATFYEKKIERLHIHLGI